MTAIVAPLLDIRAGTWTFHGARGPGHERLIAPSAWEGLSVAAILLEAVRRHDESNGVSARRDASATDVPRVAVDASCDENRDPDLGATPRLTAADLRVLATVDGRRDIRTIATLLRRDPAQVGAVVDTLRAAGVVQPAEPAAHTDAIR